MEQQYAVSAPYPPVQIAAPNRIYARAMLSNVGSCNSEMSAVSLYFYNSLIMRKDFADFSKMFQGIGIVEMHHLDIFGQLAFMLGEDPRLQCVSNHRHLYWSPGCNRYPREITALFHNAILGEQKAIETYRQQAGWIKDPNIVELLNRIILDEEHHIALFQQALEIVSK